MTINRALKHQRKYIEKMATLVLLILLLLFLGLNYQQLYSAWTIKSEATRLVKLAANAPIESQNPPPIEDHFEGKLSSDFWKFTNINGGGQVSNKMTWHSAAVTFENSLVIQHFPDPFFKDESPKRKPPMPEQYNNVALISREGFRPSPSRDVVVKFTAWVNKDFYGSAGVVFEPVGTLQKDGYFVKPFDMFGFAVTGKEASLTGIKGGFCYLALNWIPVHMNPLQADPMIPQTYEIRLHWISQTEWLGTIKADDQVQCQMQMPPFGPVEVQVWSDNVLALSHPRRVWEIAPSMELKFQDGGNKQFNMGWIQIFEAAP
jgi:hypothetical protein